MISFQNVSLHFGTQQILRNVSLRISDHERIGIVGPNGAGKSTFFNLLSGELQPDGGTVLFEGPKPTIGYLHQQLLHWSEGDTLLSYTLRSSKDLKACENEIQALEKRIPTLPQGSPERTRALARIGELQTRFEQLGGYELESRVKKSLCALGFHTNDFDRPFGEFSGGWKMRAEMVRTLISQPDLLMLDEPSNYLDLPAVEWMQSFLRSYRGTLLLISHDRYLLRTLTSVTIEIDGETATRYAGGLDYYLKERQQRYEVLLAAKRNQDRQRAHMEEFINTFRSQANKASLVQSRVKALEKLEPIVVPRQAATNGQLRLPPYHHCGVTVLAVRDAGFSYNGKDFVFRNVSFDVQNGEHVAIVGFNGLGKSTLSRLLAGERPPSEGEVILGHKVVPGYLSQDFAETIPPDRSLINVVRREDETMTEAQARALLGSFGFSGDEAFKLAGVLSGGEKIRLGFARIHARKPNFLVLDEPTTHLDLNGRQALEEAIRAYEGAIVLVSHDIEFVRRTAANIVEVSDQGVRKFLGTYDDYRARVLRDENESTEKSDSPSDVHSDPPAKPLSKKELRKERAAERDKLLPLLRSLRRRVTATEERIEKLETEQKELVGQLSNLDGKTDFATVNRRLSEIEKELTTLNQLWEQAASELAYYEAE